MLTYAVFEVSKCSPRATSYDPQKSRQGHFDLCTDGRRDLIVLPRLAGQSFAEPRLASPCPIPRCSALVLSGGRIGYCDLATVAKINRAKRCIQGRCTGFRILLDSLFLRDHVIAASESLGWSSGRPPSHCRHAVLSERRYGCILFGADRNCVLAVAQGELRMTEVASVHLTPLPSRDNFNGPFPAKPL